MRPFLRPKEGVKIKLPVRRYGTRGRYLCLRNQNGKGMFGMIVSLALAALAIWLLVDSAVEFVREGQEDLPVTEP